MSRKKKTTNIEDLYRVAIADLIHQGFFESKVDEGELPIYKHQDKEWIQTGDTILWKRRTRAERLQQVINSEGFRKIKAEQKEKRLRGEAVKENPVELIGTIPELAKGTDFQDEEWERRLSMLPSEIDRDELNKEQISLKVSGDIGRTIYRLEKDKSNRNYFVCSYCGKNRDHLFSRSIVSELRCRECIHVLYGSQRVQRKRRQGEIQSEDCERIDVRDIVKQGFFQSGEDRPAGGGLPVYRGKEHVRDVSWRCRYLYLGKNKTKKIDLKDIPPKGEDKIQVVYYGNRPTKIYLFSGPPPYADQIIKFTKDKKQRHYWKCPAKSCGERVRYLLRRPDDGIKDIFRCKICCKLNS